MQAFLYALVAPLAMAAGPARAFRLYTSSVAPHTLLSVQEIVDAADRILLQRVFGRLILRTRCLKRTLVLQRLLRRNGHDAIAWVGFDRSADRLDGHAWLTVGDERVPDPVFAPPRDFTPFLRVSDRVEIVRETAGDR